MASGFKSAKDLRPDGETPKRRIRVETDKNLAVRGQSETKGQLIEGAPLVTDKGVIPEAESPKVSLGSKPKIPAKATASPTVGVNAPAVLQPAADETVPGGPKRSTPEPTGPTGVSIVTTTTSEPAAADKPVATARRSGKAGFKSADGKPAVNRPKAGETASRAATGAPVAAPRRSGPVGGSEPGADMPDSPGTSAPDAGPASETSSGAPSPSGRASSAQPAPLGRPSKSAAAPAAAGGLAAGAAGAKATKAVPGSKAPAPGQPDPLKLGGQPRTSGGRRLASLIKKHPKGVIWGIASIISAFVSIIIFFLSIPFQIIHMAKSLLDFNFSSGDRIEHIVSRRALSRLFQEKKAWEGGRKSATGLPILDKYRNMKMDRFTKQLARDGVKMEFDGAGRLTGIRDMTTGKLQTDLSDASFSERRTAVGDIVSERIAPWRVLKRVHYTRLLRFHASVSWRFFPKEKVKDVKDILLEKARKGASTQEVTRANGDKNAQTDGSQEATDAIKETESVFDKTKDKVSALRAGTAKFKAATGKYFGYTGILALVCTVKEMADEAASKGYLDRVDQLIRVGNILPTVVAQLYTGEYLNLDTVGQLMSRYDGDSSAPKDSIDRKGWDQSAAAKRISGSPVDNRPYLDKDHPNPNYNPDLNEAANPNGFMLKKIVDVVDQVFSFIPGLNWACDKINGVLGFILQAIELVVAVFTAGAAELAALAAQLVISFVIFNVVLPKVLAAAADLAITGTENAVDSFNNGDAGLRLSAEDYHRSYGGRRLSNADAALLDQQERDEKIQVARSKGWFYRNLDLDNLNSVASTMLMKVPHNPEGVIAAITHVPQTLTANFGAIFFGSLRPAYAAPPTDINPYHFEFQGFTQADVDRYPDVIALENYLVAKDANGKSRLSVLGDPTAYTPSDGPDTNKDDLLHCFVNKYRSDTESDADPICGTLGIPTAPNDSPSVADGPNDDTVKQIYSNAGLNVAYDDDLAKYEMYLFYMHEVKGIECYSDDQDCYQSQGGTTAPDPNPAAPAPGNAQACNAGENTIDCASRLAAAILATPNIIPAGARPDLVATVNKQTITNASSCGKPVRVDPGLLYAMLQTATAGGFKITLSNIITPHDCDSFLHPLGRAFDVDTLVSPQGVSSNAGHPASQGGNPAVDKAFSEYIANLLPQGGGIGQAVSCFPANIPAGIRTGFETGAACSHIHVDVGLPK